MTASGPAKAMHDILAEVYRSASSTALRPSKIDSPKQKQIVIKSASQKQETHDVRAMITYFYFSRISKRTRGAGAPGCLVVF